MVKDSMEMERKQGASLKRPPGQNKTESATLKRLFLAVAACFGIALAVDYLASISGLPACVPVQVQRGDTDRCRVIDR